MAEKKGKFRFSFGPWNIDEGADPFGPTVRKPIAMGKKFKLVKKLGFQGIQFHDDDIVPDIEKKSARRIEREANEVKRILDSEGIVAEFVAPRLWFDARTIDGGFTSNKASERKYAIDRLKQCADICHLVGCNKIVLWFAREGTYIRAAKDPVAQVNHLLTAMNKVLAHDPDIRLLIEPKPNEPVDSAIIPSAGHAIAMSYMTDDPDRVGILIETAHSVLAGLDPSDDMGFGLAHGKLWSVHLNDQGGLKFDQDKSFGSYNLRRAFDQVRVLDRHGYGHNGEWVGLDVKTMRTQKQNVNTKHLSNSLKMFKDLVKKARSINTKLEAELIKARDYEELDRYILSHLMGTRR